jgi:hypothetical protein
MPNLIPHPTNERRPAFLIVWLDVWAVLSRIALVWSIGSITPETYQESFVEVNITHTVMHINTTSSMKANDVRGDSLARLVTTTTTPIEKKRRILRSKAVSIVLYCPPGFEHPQSFSVIRGLSLAQSSIPLKMMRSIPSNIPTGIGKALKRKSNPSTISRTGRTLAIVVLMLSGRI